MPASENLRSHKLARETWAGSGNLGRNLGSKRLGSLSRWIRRQATLNWILSRITPSATSAHVRAASTPEPPT